MPIRIAQSLLILLFVAWTVVGSSHGSMFFEICEKTSSGEQSCANYHILSYSVWLFDHYSGLITAIATGFIATFTFTLWQATVELREAGDRQADVTRILERAYISAEPRGIHLLVQGDRVIGHIGVMNAGKMPATNLSWFIDIKHSDRGDEQEFPVLDSKGRIIVPTL